MFDLISRDLVYVSLLLHQDDSLHGLVGVGVVLGELPEARFPSERFRHDRKRRRRRNRLIRRGTARFTDPLRPLHGFGKRTDADVRTDQARLMQLI